MSDSTHTRQAPVRLARITSSKGTLGKTFRLEDGRLSKSTSAFLSTGTVDNLSLSRVDDFGELLMSLTNDQVLTYGQCLRGNGPIISKKQWEKLGCPAALMQRNQDQFGWPSGPGIMMLDYDPSDAVLERAQLLDILYSVIPGLNESAHYWWPSSSSFIYDESTGIEFNGLRGQRVYIVVANAQDIPRASEILEARLWLADHGWYKISSSGAYLPRTLVDMTVFQPERIDFAAGATCEPPLVQRRGEPVRLEGTSYLDTACLQGLTSRDQRRLEKIRATEKAAKKEEADAVTSEYKRKVGKRLQEKLGLREDEAFEVLKSALETKCLLGNFLLYPASGGEVTVQELLDDRDRWHGTRFHDPIEPDYPDERIAWVNLNSGTSPYIHSHAHGPTRYILRRTRHCVDVTPGSIAPATTATLEHMRNDGGYYAHGNAIATIGGDGHVHPLGIYALKQNLELNIQFTKYDGRTKSIKSTECPDDVARRILDLKRDTVLPRLAGVALYPTMTAKGRLLDTPKYDEETGLLLLNLNGLQWPRITRTPSKEEVLQALKCLWRPLALFPFDGDTSRGVALAGLLTAVARRALPTAPAFMIVAPAAGSGKTLLGSCFVELAGGSSPISFPDSEAEINKHLVSLLRKGQAAIFFDNVVGGVDSKTLNAMLTSAEYDGRILGVSETTGPLPTNVLVVFTGNNARPTGDMNRRMLVSTIDPRVEHPYLRTFDFDPQSLVRSERMELAVASLTILAGWVATGMEPVANGSLASFESWDRLIRQAVVWVGALERSELASAAVGFGDPIAGIQAQYSTDEETETIGDLLDVWHGEHLTQEFRAKDLSVACERARRDEPSPLGQLAGALAEAFPNARHARGLGNLLKKYHKKVVRGLRLMSRSDPAAHSAVWWVEPVYAE